MAPKAKEKPKSTAPNPSQPPPPIEDLFTNLNRHIDRSEFELAVKVADQVLAVAPGNEDALRCKVVALIEADDFDRSLAYVEMLCENFWFSLSTFHYMLSSFRIQSTVELEEAYCLYRQNKLIEALESLKSDKEDVAAMLLESQILYRLGKMDACLDVYKKLQKSKIESLEINYVAGLVSAGRASEVQGALDAMRVKATSSFELAYNIACSLIERNKYADAEQLLLSAKRIGQETLMEENLADDEIENELSPIAVQLAYVWQILGQSQEAIEAYTDIINKNLADETSITVAVNNLISLKGSKDVSHGLRRVDKLFEKGDGPQAFQFLGGLATKLSAKQKEAIYTNRVLLLLHANKLDQRTCCCVAKHIDWQVMPVLLQAAVFVRENKAGKAEEILLQQAKKSPGKREILLLARAQVAAAAGHPQIAAESLSQVPDIQHMPATVATLVTLKERAGDIDGANEVLDSAIQWWTNAMTENSKLDVILQQSASFKLKHGRQEEASHIFEELVKSHGSIEAMVGLVTTAAHVNVDKAESYAKKLKPLPGLKSVDVDSLEKTSGAKHVDIKIPEPSEESKAKDKTKKKRKRKPKYPKGFDPANPGPPPDPERWLPKRERSTYRPKRKDKRAAQVRGSQGAVSRDKQEQVSTSSTPNNVASKSSQAPASSKSSSQAPPAAQPKSSSSKSSKKKPRK
uniref:Signal recognition particle subunit SRP72 n=1 Tax=Kalanchoe fedtschenkoi TaxID=63787 RepID=A0A7N0TXD1_KALFE